MNMLDLVQWPAFVTSVAAAWLVASATKRRRNIGFWVFLASNALWIAWGVRTSAMALIALQVCLAGLNIRGLFKTEEKSREVPKGSPAAGRNPLRPLRKGLFPGGDSSGAARHRRGGTARRE